MPEAAVLDYNDASSVWFWGGNCFAEPRWMRRTNLGPAAAWRTTAPVPSVWAIESSAGANPWHPSAIARGIAPSPSPSRSSPAPLAHLQKLILPLRQFTPCSSAFHLGFGLVSHLSVWREPSGEEGCGEKPAWSWKQKRHWPTGRGLWAAMLLRYNAATTGLSENSVNKSKRQEVYSHGGLRSP